MPDFQKMAYLYAIHPLKKYLFGLVVFTYVLSVVGIPIYVHYCGGELEKINYVIKSNSCCGGEEEDNDTAGDCCKDENLFLKNTTDFTFKHSSQAVFVNLVSQLFHLPISFSTQALPEADCLATRTQDLPPPRLQNSGLISASVLRI